jgi:hypothetical protein
MGRTKASNSWYVLVGEQLANNPDVSVEDLVKAVAKRRPNPNEGTIRTQRGHWLRDHRNNGAHPAASGGTTWTEDQIVAIGKLTDAQFKEIKEYVALREKVSQMFNTGSA